MYTLEGWDNTRTMVDKKVGLSISQKDSLSTCQLELISWVAILDHIGIFLYDARIVYIFSTDLTLREVYSKELVKLHKNPLLMFIPGPKKNSLEY